MDPTRGRSLGMDAGIPKNPGGFLRSLRQPAITGLFSYGILTKVNVCFNGLGSLGIF